MTTGNFRKHLHMNHYVALIVAIVLVSVLQVVAFSPAQAAGQVVISQPLNDSQTTMDTGQSFTATATGTITTIRVISGSATSATLKVFNGSGVSGSPVLTQSVSLINSGIAFQTFTLSTPVPVVAGQVYTFYFVDVNVTLLFKNADVYAGGSRFYSGIGATPGQDIAFEVVIDVAGASACTGQLNCSSGDEYVQVLNRSDSAGNPALQFWCISADGKGYLGGVITQADLKNVPATPSTHTLVKTIDCRVPVTFWVLTTGEYQINIGPNAKGNTVVMIFKGLPPTDMKVTRLDNDH